MIQRKSTPKRQRLRKPGPSGVQLGEQAARGMVMAGAALLCANRGVRAVSVEDILAHAGISRRTFYRLYKSKEDVVVGLNTFPETLLKLFNGDNFGKLVLQFA